MAVLFSPSLTVLNMVSGRKATFENAISVCMSSPRSCLWILFILFKFFFFFFFFFTCFDVILQPPIVFNRFARLVLRL